MHVTRKLVIVVATACALFALYAVAQAKYAPYIEAVDEDWGDLSSPWVSPGALGMTKLMGHSNTPTDRDAFAYTVTSPVVDLIIELLVPVCPGVNDDYYPSLALVGPGLLTTNTDQNALGLRIPDGMGARVFAAEPATGPREKSIMADQQGDQQVYVAWKGSVDIPAAGTYTLVVWEPDGNLGPYILYTGNQEPNFAGFKDNDLDKAFDADYRGTWIKDDCAAAAAEATS